MLSPNTILQNRYRIVHELGHGGMGTVYEALDQRVNCIVALKETIAGTNDEARRAFEREASLLGNLRHSALPKVMDYFSEDDGDFLVMEDAQDFMNKLNGANDGFKYRLPSEAEWEYACRAGTTTAFAFGDSILVDQANFDLHGEAGKTIPVGSFQPNAFGLFDTHGNVWEWCQDWYHDKYNAAPTDGRAWLSGGDQKYRVLRGGSWRADANSLRSAVRNWASPGDRDDSIGFRVVAVAQTK